MKYTAPSWESFHTSVFRLAKKIYASDYRFDLIVAIARGGLTVAHIFSDFFNRPITTFTISTYTDLKQHRVPEIILKIGDKLDHKQILLVDDVSDTGKTFVRGINYLKELGASEIRTAAVYIKPWTKFVPDYFVKKTAAWIVFPYEVKETIGALSKNLKQEKISDRKIRKVFAKIGIPKRYLDFFYSS
ncbi:phosphoribosyltransferase [Candidatus Roizmanbacteria bacterium]|nr:phosphoribosyltransferase [Candidatus Roizmanbacteria bacterium]